MFLTPLTPYSFLSFLFHLLFSFLYCSSSLLSEALEWCNRKSSSTDWDLTPVIAVSLGFLICEVEIITHSVL